MIQGLRFNSRQIFKALIAAIVVWNIPIVFARLRSLTGLGFPSFGIEYVTRLLIGVGVGVVVFIFVKSNKLTILLTGIYAFMQLIYSIKYAMDSDTRYAIEYHVGGAIQAWVVIILCALIPCVASIMLMLSQYILNKSDIKPRYIPKSLFIATAVLLVVTTIVMSPLVQSYYNNYEIIALEYILLAMSMVVFYFDIDNTGLEKEKNSDWIAEIGVGMHILFLFVTVGIWTFIWIYQVTKYLNKVKDLPPRSPGAETALCIIPFYIIYWMYVTGQRIDKLYNEKGRESSIATVCLILAIFINIVAVILVQSKVCEVNELDQGEQTPPASNIHPSNEEQSIVSAEPIQTITQGQNNKPEEKEMKDIADDLNVLKGLLDDGIITQEEFDQKKKELLKL